MELAADLNRGNHQPMGIIVHDSTAKPFCTRWVDPGTIR
jgi:hypothetical protein